MTFTLRSAEMPDADSIATILSDWIDETPWMPRIHTREEDRGFGRFLIEKTSVLVAVEDAVVGFLGRREGSIEALYIHHAHRGRGVG